MKKAILTCILGGINFLYSFGNWIASFQSKKDEYGGVSFSFDSMQLFWVISSLIVLAIGVISIKESKSGNEPLIKE